MPYTPDFDHARLAPLLDALALLRQEVEALNVPDPLARWLRRQVEARGAHMSTSIEGNPMTEPEVRELFARDPATAAAPERENLDYRDAARLARQAADDPRAEIDGGLLRGLHFLVVRTTDRTGSAGQFRQRQNRIADASGQTVYLPPAPADASRLTDDLLRWLREARQTVHPLVLGAAGHLEFVSIHPFDDGNGRTARALTAYFAARGGWNLNGFAATEAAFGRDRSRYYAQLQKHHGDRYVSQSTDVNDWCVWVLKRLAIEVATAVGVVRRWEEFRTHGPDTRWARTIAEGSMYLALAGSVSRSEYVRAVEVSPATAVAQLNLLVENGLAIRTGRGRSTRYLATDDSAARFAYEAYREATQRFPEP